MLRLLFFSFSVLFVFTATSQDYIIDKDKKAKSERELYLEGDNKHKNLLLIPYKPVMHLPDPAGDVELLMKSGKGYDEMLNYFRIGLDLSFGTKFKDGYIVYSLLRNNEEDAIEDLHRIYGSVKYDYEERPKDEKQSIKDGIKRLVNQDAEDKSKKQIESNTKIRDGELRSENIEPGSRYMNVTITDPDLLVYLKGKYAADVFVFVNQLEVKKSFAKGSDVAYGNYGREVKVHYTVIGQDGKQLYGDVEAVGIVGKADNLNEIINSSFPQISSNVFDRLPYSTLKSDVLERQKEYQKKAEKQDILRND